MTGRYYYRTGIVDTYLGRSMMHADEVTLAEMLGKAGYRTGLFGKWHLGDNYPMRPGDRGFAESVAIKGGGLGQPSDFPGGGSYTVDGDTLTFSNLVTTEMACPGPQSDVEAAFLGVLGAEAVDFVIDSGQLTLLAGDNGLQFLG